MVYNTCTCYWETHIGCAPRTKDNTCKKAISVPGMRLALSHESPCSPYSTPQDQWIMWCCWSCRQPSACTADGSQPPAHKAAAYCNFTRNTAAGTPGIMVEDLMTTVATTQTPKPPPGHALHGLQVNKACWAACSRQGTTNHSSMACCTAPYSPCRQQCPQPPGSTAIMATLCVKVHSTATVLLRFAAQTVPTPQHSPCHANFSTPLRTPIPRWDTLQVPLC